MKAIAVVGQGKDSRLELAEAPRPELRPGEVRISIAASAVNRADLMQRRGLYPPPPGASNVLGLECSGVIAEVGSGVSGFARGERVMALLAGGGYAEEACVDAGSLIPVPKGMSLLEAAGIPEVNLTCHLNLFQLAALPVGGWALVHGGGSGIGTAAIQLLRLAGAHSIVTAGSAAKCAQCLELGADVALDYTKGEFAPAVLEKTGGQGVDVALDSIGGPYLAQHLQCLKIGGRLVLIGLMGGAKAEANLALVVGKRLSIIGSTLRARPVAEKAEIVRGFRARFGAALESGKLHAVVDQVIPLADAQRAHDRVEASTHFGKVILQVRSDLS
ncbi:MAG TPA: NAD(P)H-quinone oxidoreductase [Myxococcota bacterium]|nr:NAD(P)H-quinone oxidoreductase [Myxococcota bacterium]